MSPFNQEELPHAVMSACMEVHRELGPGLPQEAYLAALAQELRMRELFFDRDRPLQVFYKGALLDVQQKVDFVVEDSIVIDCQSDDSHGAADKRRLINSLRLGGYEVGFLVDFAVPDFRDGIKRVIVSGETPKVPWKEA
ncbi:MAG: GxxExxY protein [Verrucomicrobiota bacterium]